MITTISPNRHYFTVSNTTPQFDKPEPPKPEQKEIWYKDIVAAGFTFEEASCPTFEAQYGYPWCIVTKNLTKRVYLDWSQETRLVELIRINNNKDCDIKARMPIRDLAHMQELIAFFCDPEVKVAEPAPALGARSVATKERVPAKQNRAKRARRGPTASRRHAQTP